MPVWGGVELDSSLYPPPPPPSPACPPPPPQPATLPPARTMTDPGPACLYCPIPPVVFGLGVLWQPWPLPVWPPLYMCSQHLALYLTAATWQVPDVRTDPGLVAGEGSRQSRSAALCLTSLYWWLVPSSSRAASPAAGLPALALLHATYMCLCFPAQLACPPCCHSSLPPLHAAALSCLHCCLPTSPRGGRGCGLTFQLASLLACCRVAAFAPTLLPCHLIPLCPSGLLPSLLSCTLPLIPLPFDGKNIPLPNTLLFCVLLSVYLVY